MDTKEILNVIDSIKSNNTLHYYLNGGCYIFAKELQKIVGGNLRYLVQEYHFIVETQNKLYDASGNVTNKYKDSKYITESDFIKRNKLFSSIKI